MLADQMQSEPPGKPSIFIIHAHVRSRSKAKTISSDNGNFHPDRLRQTTKRVCQRPNPARKVSPITKISPSYHSLGASQLNSRNNEQSNDHHRQSNVLESVEENSYQEYQNPRTLLRRDFPQSNLADASTNKNPTVLDRKKARKCFGQKSLCACSTPCIVLFLLIGLLLAGAIVGTVVGVVTTAKKISTNAITSSTTIVTPTTCSCLCSGEAWRFDSGYLARWPFDGTFNDLTNTYNATPYASPSFSINGYVNQALLFNPSLIQSLSAPYIPLAYTSFTVEVWLKPTFSSNPSYSSILGLCPVAAENQCLHIVIRKNGSNYYLFFGFFSDDCQGNTSLTANQWIHAAFVFDITTLTQSVYLNGILDNSCTASSPIIATTGLVTIGAVPAIISVTNTNFYQGYMDHLTITQRAKSSCEILEDATLAACFLFDAAAPYTDFGPNSLPSNASSPSIISPGHNNQAISFNGTSYLQASSFTALGFSTASFSIALWVRPRSVLGPIVHISSSSNGLAWCLPFLGISSNGSILAQIFASAAVTVWGPVITTSQVWSHVTQTWSSTHGLRLYVNSSLVASDTSAVSCSASGSSNFATLANSLSGYTFCAGGGLGYHVPTALACDIDDFRVYSRELKASEISTIYQS